ncbi:MAG: Macrolide export ATP-binding/permease protein MacB [Flavobacteriales bacterium]|jgi:putative ABC transport system permease protein|nr:MAG: ABC transporter permease [Flavobacteriales bacterium]CAI8261584.1 MAG: Macrolide export ATP-binding/permease protein MacB [Flavobacteriales bacterium]|tara:strand:- start:977 stop:2206 length:1230 start_codon:yes stop_codon:yes gene_type:complete
MWNRDRWQEMFYTLRKNKLRTTLSGFTVAMGIFIFVLLFGFGNGLKNSFQEFFMDDSTNTVWLYPGQTEKPYRGFKAKRRIIFKNDDLVDIQQNFPFFIEYLTPRISRGALVKRGKESNNYTIRAVAPGHQYAEKTIITNGRYINEADVQNKTKFATIGRLVENDLFGDKPSIGQQIDVGGISFKVVGVFKDDGGDNEERLIYIPYTTRQRLEKSNDRIDQIIVAFRPELGYAGALALEKKLNAFMRKKHNIAPNDRSGIYVRNVAADLKETQQFAGVLQWVVFFIGIGTLLAGIIGISNIMVFVVKERTKELGIRKAIGATPKSVIGMILHESVFITTIAGYVGLLAGVGTLSLIGDSLEEFFIINPYISTNTAVIATLILILFGAIAGYIPARRAAKIKPIIALRDE